MSDDDVWKGNIPPKHFPPPWVLDEGYAVRTYGIPKRGEELWSPIANKIVIADGTEQYPRVVLIYVGKHRVMEEQATQCLPPPPPPPEEHLPERCPTCGQMLPELLSELARASIRSIVNKPPPPEARSNVLPFRRP